jgi:hypothetical protein
VTAQVTEAERDHAVAALRDHFGAGRLDAAALGERLELVLHAETRGQLDAALEGLPAVVPPHRGFGPDRPYQGRGEDGFVRTEELFIDPASGRMTRVYEDPTTGRRRYVVEDGAR